MKDSWSCPECANGTVSLYAGPGRTCRYEDDFNLEIPEDLEIPTCNNCREEFVNCDLADKLDNALSKIYKEKYKVC